MIVGVRREIATYREDAMHIGQVTRRWRSVVAGAVLCTFLTSLASLCSVYVGIGEAAAKAAVAGIAESLSDEGTARKTFGEMVTADTVDAMLADEGARLRTGLTSKNTEERIGAAMLLGEAGPDGAPFVPLLTRALNDPSIEVRRQAAYALGEIGPAADPSLHRLRELSVTGHDRVWSEAEKAIKKIVDEPVVDRQDATNQRMHSETSEESSDNGHSPARPR